MRSIWIALCTTWALSAARANEADMLLSVPTLGTIERVAADGSGAEAMASGLVIPHYGHFLEDGRFYVPDRGWGGILRVHDDGTIVPIAAGGTLVMPVVLVPDPASDGMVVGDLLGNKIVRVGLDGSQTVMHDAASTGGLLQGPDGLAYDPAGNLYVANLYGSTVIRIDPAGNATLVSDSPLIHSPGNLALDGAGNLFVAAYEGHAIVRVRPDSGEVEVFAADLSKISYPNDLKISRSHGLLTTTRHSSVVAIDALGQIDVLYQDPAYGLVTGVAVAEDASPCSGTFTTYGAGLPGTGGVTPRLQAIFSPCPGHAVALELRDFRGGASALLVVGLEAAEIPLVGGKLLVAPAPSTLFVPLPLPSSGDLRIPFVVPDLPALVGARFRFQAIAADPEAIGGAAFSNGLLETIGS